MRIDAEVYRHFRNAILDSLSESPGLTFAVLATEVAKRIKKTFPSFGKSVSWYTITIRLDLEAKGEVTTYTEKGKKYARLRKIRHNGQKS
jgi:hypothetical protein